MYCPKCATPHTDGAKFCRSCGIELEAVALVLSGKSAQPAKASKKKLEPQTTQDWLEKHVEAVRNITEGAILLAVSLLIGVALALFVPGSFDAPWILIWMVFFGWMAVWGGIALADGVGGVLESKSRLRLLGLAGKESAIDATPRQLSSAGEPPIITNPSVASRPSPPLSITEGTTRQLDDLVEK